ncbi:hypothetical protein LWI29_011249 [Acer saccharum]|uniref:TF-B3 domain-containing protein n=1 Tax=Acer saccharum TaxID=4024 RepID=A0AA39VBI7_ACESA|nr:hypothetical protein LWI29_011249 [Acer saccharum]
MVESNLTYEECRRQRLEENKKRMEELNLANLSHSLKKTTNTHTPSPLKKRSRNPQLESDQVRRSSRVANRPPPNYKDDVVVLPFMTRRRSYPRRNLLNRVFASDKERAYAIERAEELQSGLDSQYPSFVKPMLQSHVTGCFWLGLPVYFCKNHLPINDETIILVDEEGNESPTKYLPRKTGLSGGWRGFSLEHGLVDGDALVFHLVKPTTFKVYIIRAYELEDNEDEDEKDKNEDSGVTPLSSTAKRTRANNGDKYGKDKNEDSNVAQLSSVAKRTRSSKK